MAYRNKTYVCFDGDEDIRYYRLMKAWKANDKIEFYFYDAHDLHQCRDSSQEETIKRSLRERMNTAKLFLVLVGEKTKNLTKFVRWEIDLAINKELPIVVVNLNGRKNVDETLCPPLLRDTLAIHIPFAQAVMQHAIDTWPERHAQLKKEGETGSYSYKEELYKRIETE